VNEVLVFPAIFADLCVFAREFLNASVSKVSSRNVAKIRKELSRPQSFLIIVLTQRRGQT
jgi:hypothetical protein